MLSNHTQDIFSDYPVDLQFILRMIPVSSNEKTPRPLQTTEGRQPNETPTENHESHMYLCTPLCESQAEGKPLVEWTDDELPLALEDDVLRYTLPTVAQWAERAAKLMAAALPEVYVEWRAERMLRRQLATWSPIMIYLTLTRRGLEYLPAGRYLLLALLEA